MEPVNGLTEEKIKEILTAAHGDLYRAAQALGITTLQMDRMVRYNVAVSAFYLEIQKVKADPEYERQSHQWFVDQLQRASVIYRLVGYEVLHDIATMKADTAAMTEVKRKAAASLKGEELILRNGADVDREMDELRREYDQDAPRIKETRARLLENRTGALLAGPVNEPADLRQAVPHLDHNLDDLVPAVGVGVGRD